MIRNFLFDILRFKKSYQIQRVLNVSDELSEWMRKNLRVQGGLRPQPKMWKAQAYLKISMELILLGMLKKPGHVVGVRYENNISVLPNLRDLMISHAF